MRKDRGNLIAFYPPGNLGRKEKRFPNQERGKAKTPQRAILGGDLGGKKKN